MMDAPVYPEQDPPIGNASFQKIEQQQGHTASDPAGRSE
jgi:hypothetical protein